MAELKKLALNQPSTNRAPSVSAPSSTPSAPANKKIITVVALVALAGIASGYALSQFFPKSPPAGVTSPTSSIDPSNLKVGDAVGVESDTFSDTAEGVIEKGGINGEGSHKLIRPGGESQTVYLTSSMIDLDGFTGHKVTVWGETFAAQKAGWLMDVGRIQVLELNVSQPE